jgi:hypothetical protein
LKRYYYTAEVKQQFLDTVSLSVEAASVAEAEALIKQAMRDFPDEVPHDRIKHCYIENRQKLDTEVTNLERRVPVEPSN